jgi:hypothetical protein
MGEHEDGRRLSASQAEQVRRAYKSLTALQDFDVSKMIPSLKDINPRITLDIQSMAKALVPMPNVGIDFAKSLQVNIPTFKIDAPPLMLDYQRLFGPALNFEHLGIKNLLDTSSVKLFDDIYGAQRDHFKGIFEKFDSYFDKLLPPIWRGVRDLDNIETIMLDEGLALAWVPPTDILTKVLAATTPQERRRILGRNWKGIVAACRQSLESTTTNTVSEYRRFALKAVTSLETGQPEAAQALAANMLDTMLRQTLTGRSRNEVTNQNTRLSIDDLPMRAAMVFGGIWGSHTQFYTDRGDSIPRRFTRHASAHGVSSLQYSRINAVIALMHCTAYIMLTDSGDLRTAA